MTMLHMTDAPLSNFGSVVGDSVQAGSSQISAEYFPLEARGEVRRLAGLG